MNEDDPTSFWYTLPDRAAIKHAVTGEVMAYETAARDGVKTNRALARLSAADTMEDVVRPRLGPLVEALKMSDGPHLIADILDRAIASVRFAMQGKIAP